MENYYRKICFFLLVTSLVTGFCVASIEDTNRMVGVVIPRAPPTKTNGTKQAVAVTVKQPMTLLDRFQAALRQAPLYLFNGVSGFVVNILSLVNNIQFISNGVSPLDPEITTEATTAGTTKKPRVVTQAPGKQGQSTATKGTKEPEEEETPATEESEVTEPDTESAGEEQRARGYWGHPKF